ncbi:hypothetical protein A9F13_27g00528 [Clavispora lusitaniae]|uniref:Uncharacterized protein n=1 Tax=Clavispora lusitaniae TaxID=36911 RepID=A0AA91PV46_CLALS|nr:hypothetical protein A9F13_27g00528 [Clavispora lusitaniae]
MEIVVAENQDKKNEPLALLNLSDENVRDMQFAGASFVVVIIILFHYAWIMRQMVIHRDLSTSTLVTYFGTLGVTSIASITVLVKFVYPKIYKKVSQDKKTQ